MPAGDDACFAPPDRGRPSVELSMLNHVPRYSGDLLQWLSSRHGMERRASHPYACQTSPTVSRPLCRNGCADAGCQCWTARASQRIGRSGAMIAQRRPRENHNHARRCCGCLMKMYRPLSTHNVKTKNTPRIDELARRRLGRTLPTSRPMVIRAKLKNISCNSAKRTYYRGDGPVVARSPLPFSRGSCFMDVPSRMPFVFSQRTRQALRYGRVVDRSLPSRLTPRPQQGEGGGKYGRRGDPT